MAEESTGQRMWREHGTHSCQLCCAAVLLFPHHTALEILSTEHKEASEAGREGETEGGKSTLRDPVSSSVDESD